MQRVSVVAAAAVVVVVVVVMLGGVETRHRSLRDPRFPSQGFGARRVPHQLPTHHRQSLYPQASKPGKQSQQSLIKKTMIRIGEHNLTSEIDCQVRGGRRTCAPLFQTFNPVEIIRHSDFNTRGTVSDDIALIRLDKEVEFNVSSPGRRFFVAGGEPPRGTAQSPAGPIPFVVEMNEKPSLQKGLLPEAGSGVVRSAVVRVVGGACCLYLHGGLRGWILDNLKP
ncbi:hypothetical protein GWK47_053128 [Chionoecetes opilio]|uniref:Uncharacterized protein n=1 Tax=Chionoecetes opilio TaxID=41210 RepID=A0A8J4Y8A4_CHIOP|nr:hypothetical protein GWK47_053128 [Chionoecetes opilio]